MRLEHPGDSSPGRHRTPSRAVVLLLVLLTVLAVIALGGAWAVITIPSRGIALDDSTGILAAERAALGAPLFWLGIAIVAAPWIALWHWFRWRHRSIPVITAAVAVVLAGGFFWRGQVTDQPITFVTYRCASGLNPFSGPQGIPDACGRAQVDAALTIGTRGDPGRYTATVTADDRADVSDLPVGTYDAVLTITAPAETAAIIVGVATGSGIVPLASLGIDDPLAGASRTWSTEVTMRPGYGDWAILYFPSEGAPAPDARIVFDVRDCAGSSPASFDPGECRPMALDDWILRETTHQTGPATWRQPVLTRDGSTVTYANLEARTYLFTPLIVNRAITIDRYDVLVIPADGPQTADASVLAHAPERGQEEFGVEIAPGTRTVAYTIYVFPRDTVYAGSPALHTRV